jgi:hypothetical protein
VYGHQKSATINHGRLVRLAYRYRIGRDADADQPPAPRHRRANAKNDRGWPRGKVSNLFDIFEYPTHHFQQRDG